jgi:transposase-like protein
MSKRLRPTYSPEFRLEVAQQVVDNGRNIRDVAESLGLGNSTVDKWARLRAFVYPTVT